MYALLRAVLCCYSQKAWCTVHDCDLPGGESRSEIVRLRQQIEAEYLAMQRGFYGLALGKARHRVIAFHLRRADLLRGELATQVGEEAALQMMCSLYNQALDRHLSLPWLLPEEQPG